MENSFTKNFLHFFLISLSAGLLGQLFPACEKNPSSPSLYDPNYTGGPAPLLMSISPQDSAFAGVDTLTVTGQNFSIVPSENLLYVNSAVTSIVSTSTTQLKAITPLVTGDSIKVKLAVMRSSQFSNVLYLKLRPAINGFGNLRPLELARAIATDALGNLYVSISSPSDIGVRRYTSAGDSMTYASSALGVSQRSALKMGPGGYLYAAHNVRAVYRYSPGGGSAPTAPWVAFPSGVVITDMDFDANQNLWAGGNNSNVYCIKQNQTSKSSPFVANVRSVRVFNGYLYMSAFKDFAEGIWRAPIISDSIGAAEKYFDFGSAFPGYQAQGITFSAAGNLYIATNAPEGVVIVTPAKA